MSKLPQLERAAICALISGGTRAYPSRICQPPPRARQVDTSWPAMSPGVVANA